jgi:RNase adapter protein RapZ
LRLVIISGLSGSGKSVALHMLEDLNYYCVDNIPAALLKPLVAHTLRSSESLYQRTAVGIDARNTASEIALVPELVRELKSSGIDCELLFLTSSEDELLRRYAETRRKHPLSRGPESLREAIAMERSLLDPIAQAADVVLDTSRQGAHGLRETMRRRFEARARPRMSIVFESFGFKAGIPGDADFVFDARSLPNPYWEPELRPLNGLDSAVAAWLQNHAAVQRLIDDIAHFVEGRIPEFVENNRSYLTIAVGCTGGQHRSVYLVEHLARRFSGQYADVSAQHSALPATGRR